MKRSREPLSSTKDSSSKRRKKELENSDSLNSNADGHGKSVVELDDFGEEKGKGKCRCKKLGMLFIKKFLLCLILFQIFWVDFHNK